MSAVAIWVFSILVFLLFVVLGWWIWKKYESDGIFVFDPVVRKMHRKCNFIDAEEPSKYRDTVLDMLSTFKKHLNPKSELTFSNVNVENTMALDLFGDDEVLYENFEYDYIPHDNVKTESEVFNEVFTVIQSSCTSFQCSEINIEKNIPPYLQEIVNMINKGTKCYIDVPYILQMHGTKVCPLKNKNTSITDTFIGKIDIVLLKNKKYHLLNVIVFKDEIDMSSFLPLNVCRRNGLQQMMELTYLPPIYNIQIICKKEHCIVKLPVILL